MAADEIIRQAAAFAANRHARQVDKSGMPYVGHVGRVAKNVMQCGGSPEQVAAAWLHDVIEDTHCTPEDLLNGGIPEPVVELVLALTQAPGQSNQNYWHQVRSVPDALLVKLCDIYDNLDPFRLAQLDPRAADKLRGKYGLALANLCTESVDG